MATNNNGNSSTASDGTPPGGAGATDRNSVQQGRPRERKGGPKRVRSTRGRRGGQAGAEDQLDQCAAHARRVDGRTH